MYIQEYALLKCKCVNSKMHVQNTVNQNTLLYVNLYYCFTYVIYITWYDIMITMLGLFVT